MDWWTRLPGFRRSPAGLEWQLWRRLPALLLIGLVLPLLWLAAAWWALPEPATAAQDRAFWLSAYRVAGVMILHLTLMLTLAIGCFIVRVMKGPAYVADRYPPAGREPPG